MWWMPIDIVLILFAYVMFRIFPRLNHTREVKQDVT